MGFEKFTCAHLFQNCTRKIMWLLVNNIQAKISVTLFGRFCYNTEVLHLKLCPIDGKFDGWIHDWICKCYSFTLYKNCIVKIIFQTLSKYYLSRQKKEGKDCHGLAPVLDLRLSGWFSRNFLYLRVYLHLAKCSPRRPRTSVTVLANFNFES